MVRPHLPAAVASLARLAGNLRWSWDEGTRDLFRAVDADRWRQCQRNPVALLSSVPQARLEELAADAGFVAALAEVTAGLDAELGEDRWFQARSSPLREVAYFSPEFGISAALPQYSGGLGVLAGDHLKAASDLGVPLVGVGLLYRHGYFSQVLDGDGWQTERYPTLDPELTPITPCDGLTVTIDLAGRTVAARVWRAQVGRVALYLMDSDLEVNDAAGRTVTDRLYGGDTEHRLAQEILLGVGGVRALRALGHDPQVFHSNEGHAGFLGLENIRRHVEELGLAFPEAVEAVRAGTLFTTHTPVPAGIDRFPRELMARYFGSWCTACKITLDELMSLGHEPGEAPDAPFNMAVMGLRLSAWANGVSRLHAAVSRSVVFAGLWPEVPDGERPISHVTNGVHVRSWVAPAMRELLDRHLDAEWQRAGTDRWDGIHAIGDDELWSVRERGAEALVAFVRQRLRGGAERRGLAGLEAAWCDEVLDPHLCTIGFSRRFAAYKRATLLLSQPERLRSLLLHPHHPVQMVFAGKAHPADDNGKSIIQKLVRFCRDPELRHRIVFLEDYDIDVARALYQGADVWLNNPRRPLEACGTSGEKAALNGALNCSILDGWWDECYDGTNGWGVPSAEAQEDLDRRDELEANALFAILEAQVAPLFAERPDGRPPGPWLARVRASLASLGPFVPAARMVRQYVADLYEPAAQRRDDLAADDHARARDLSRWQARVARHWHEVGVAAVEADADAVDAGETVRVTAEITLGGLGPEDVEVQLVHGDIEGGGGAIVDHAVEPMAPMGGGTYAATLRCAEAGRRGITARVVPRHPDLVTFAHLGLVALPPDGPPGP